MSKPVWIGVAILMEDGTTDTWMLNAADGHIGVRIEQAGIVPPPGWRTDPNWINQVLVPTHLDIYGKARRWGPDAGHGSPFILTQREIEQ